VSELVTKKSLPYHLSVFKYSTQRTRSYTEFHRLFNTENTELHGVSQRFPYWYDSVWLCGSLWTLCWNISTTHQAR